MQLTKVGERFCPFTGDFSPLNVLR